MTAPFTSHFLRVLSFLPLVHDQCMRFPSTSSRRAPKKDVRNTSYVYAVSARTPFSIVAASSLACWLPGQSSFVSLRRPVDTPESFTQYGQALHEFLDKAPYVRSTASLCSSSMTRRRLSPFSRNHSTRGSRHSSTSERMEGGTCCGFLFIDPGSCLLRMPFRLMMLKCLELDLLCR